jgi:hypothetical protein
MSEDKVTILTWITVNYPDDRTPLTLREAVLLREYADWIEEVGPHNIMETGNIGLPSGSIKWRRLME